MQIFTKIDLDLLRPAVQVIVHAKQNDKASRFIQANLWEGGQPFAPAEVLAVFRATKPDGTATFYDTNENGDPAITLSGNVATIELVEQVLTVPGDVAAELNLYTGTGEKLTSFTFTIRVQASVLNDAEISSSDYFNVLTSTLTQAQAAAERAEAAADRAEDLSGELVKSVNGQAPDSNGAVSVDVGVLTVNGQAPDSSGNVNVQAGVTSVFGREGAVTAQTGDYNVSQITGAVRPNLLDNWYFGNPVNQRGQTNYTANGYTIDRWYNIGCSYDAGTQVLTNTASYNSTIRQLIENASLYAGQKMTLSVLVENVSGTCTAAVNGADQVNPIGSSFGFVNLQNGLNTATFTAPSTITNAYLCFSISTYVGASVKIIAAKLELGEGQTLAHQDESENWVLNEIPDYAEELAKCQRYFYAVRTTGNNMLATAIANTTTNLLFAMPLPVPMRANPAASYSNLLYSKAGGSAGVAPSSVSPISTINNETAIRTLMLGGSFTVGTPYALILTNGGYLYLDANL